MKWSKVQQSKVKLSKVKWSKVNSQLSLYININQKISIEWSKAK